MGGDDRDIAWLADKDQLLQELNDYITRCSNKKPAPAQYIRKLLEIRTLIEISTQEELGEFMAWWEGIRPNE